MSRKAEVDIVGRDRFSAAAKSAANGAKHAHGEMDKLKSGFGKLSAASLAVGAAVMGASKILDKGLGMALSKATAQVVLGERGFAQLTTASEKTAHSLGMSRAEFIASAGQVARLTANLGFSKTEAATFGAQLPGLAQKLSLLSGGTVGAAEASDMLSSALAGEFDPLQRVGIAISAARVEQEAANISKREGGRISLEQAKALAVLEITTRQTADADKVLATEAGRQAQKVAEAKAQWKEFGDTLISTVTPALADVATGMTDTAAKVADGYSSWSKLGTSVKETLTFWKLESKEREANAAAAATQNAAVNATSASLAAMKRNAEDVKAAEDKMALAIEKASQAAREQSDAILGTREAARGFQAAIDDASAALEENGRTLNITTAKGRANQAALDGIASAANRQRDAMIKSGASQKQLDAALAASRGALIETASRFGMTRAEARNYANAVLGIPKVVTTTVNVQVNEARIARIRAEIADLRSQSFAPSSYAKAGAGSGVARTGGPTELAVTNQVYLDGAPFYAMTRTAVDAATSRAAHRARVGRR